MTDLSAERSGNAVISVTSVRVHCAGQDGLGSKILCRLSPHPACLRGIVLTSLTSFSSSSSLKVGMRSLAVIHRLFVDYAADCNHSLVVVP